MGPRGAINATVPTVFRPLTRPDMRGFMEWLTRLQANPPPEPAPIPTPSPRGIGHHPEFVASVVYLLQVERYTRPDVADMFGVSLARFTRLLHQRGCYAIDSVPATSREWDDQAHAFRPSAKRAATRTTSLSRWHASRRQQAETSTSSEG